MKKKLTTFLAASFITLALVACGSNKGSGGHNPPPPTKYTVAFNVNDERFKTLRLDEGSLIDEASVGTPDAPEGYLFDGWYDHADATYKLDFETYTVTHDVTFDASFVEDEEPDPFPELDVNAVKEADHEYYLSFGWWESLDSATSYLTVKDVKIIYANLLTYLRATGVSEQNIANVQFRNYSSSGVANMGAAVNEDGDVDILFGVGNNINTTAGVSLKNGNDGKFQAPMGTHVFEAGKDRYVANPASSSDEGTELFIWLKNTDCGKAALVRVLTQQEVEDSLAVVIDYTVRIHGETVQEVHIEEAGVNVTPNTVVVPEGYHLVGYALTAEGEVVIEKSSETAAITYAEITANAAQYGTLDLYPIFEENPVVTEDLVVYIQVNGSNLTQAEADLFETRYRETLTDENVRFTVLDKSATDFKNEVNAQADADVIIGGNNPLSSMGQHSSTPKNDDDSLKNSGAKHFKSTNRKIIVSSFVSTDHLTLAADLVEFFLADAPAMNFTTAFWPKHDNGWLSTTEISNITAGIKSSLIAYFATDDEATLLSRYNITLSFEDVDVEGNSVDTLVTMTNALKDGKGADLLVGAGGNIESKMPSTAGRSKVMPAAMSAQGRRVALPNDNLVAKYLYNNYFVEQTQE